MIDMDEIRKEVAIKHDVLLGNDDPLLMNVTINDLLLQQCVADLNARHEANVKVLVKAVMDGRVAAEKIVQQGGAYVSDQVHTAVTAAMEEGREEIRKDLRLAWVKIDSAIKVAAIWAAVSSIFAVVAVVF